MSCYDNQLTALDVSHKSDLLELRCNANQLTTLNASHNPRLERIYCEQNKLTALDVSANPLLKHLHCYENQLTALDVSGAPMLLFLFIDHNNLPSVSAVAGTEQTQLTMSSVNSFRYYPQNTGGGGGGSFTLTQADLTYGQTPWCSEGSGSKSPTTRRLCAPFWISRTSGSLNTRKTCWKKIKNMLLTRTRILFDKSRYFLAIGSFLWYAVSE